MSDLTQSIDTFARAYRVSTGDDLSDNLVATMKIVALAASVADGEFIPYEIISALSHTYDDHNFNGALYVASYIGLSGTLEGACVHLDEADMEHINDHREVLGFSTSDEKNIDALIDLVHSYELDRADSEK